MTLTAFMAAQVSDSGIAVQRGGTVTDYTAWVQGRLVFNEVPLRDVIQELTRAYGVDIHLADPALGRHKMTLAVSVANESLSAILHDLTFTIQAHCVRDGVTYVIMSGSSTPAQQRKPFLQQEKSYGR
jgi:ferric-dicitrate binding protein FerR (iron transport regulator)